MKLKDMRLLPDERKREDDNNSPFTKITIANLRNERTLGYNQAIESTGNIDLKLDEKKVMHLICLHNYKKPPSACSFGGLLCARYYDCRGKARIIVSAFDSGTLFEKENK